MLPVSALSQCKSLKGAFLTKTVRNVVYFTQLRFPEAPLRADRLISLLMLLQARGRMTAAQLAGELEVSERTIYRDVDALSFSGVPVYTDRGPDGGISLLEGYRAEFTGLTDAEQRAVFLLTIPSAVADLGLDRALASALTKLSGTIMSQRHGQEARVRQRFYLDPNSWRVRSNTAPFLSNLHYAAWEDRSADISYRLPSGAVVEQRVDVYGLVAKEGAWYVVYALASARNPEATEENAIKAPLDSRVDSEGHVRERFLRPGVLKPQVTEPELWQALPLASLLEVRVAEPFPRRFDFDLVKGWEYWCKQSARPPFEMTLRVEPALVPRLSSYGIAPHHYEDPEPDAEGMVALVATCDSFETARSRVLALGRAVEVLEPEPLRRSIIDYAQQIVARYSSRGPYVTGESTSLSK
jgi:predicted DNA-binding transcriptional regulator YafY